MPGRILLWLSSQIYGAAVAVRNSLYDCGILKSHSFGLPVICIGNITVGGTGKTPHVIWLAERLSSVVQVAVLSRGYLRKSRGFRKVTPRDTTTDAGDEPLLMARSLPQARVFVDRDRVHGIRKIMTWEPPAGAVILDDGFQHRAVKAGMNILLTNWNRLMTRDRLLPLGRLRESIRGMRRANIIIVTKVPPETTAAEMDAVKTELKAGARQSIYFTTLAYGDPLPLFHDTQPQTVTTDVSVLMVTGIANPAPMASYLSTLSERVTQLAFPDHHMYTESDIAKIKSAFDAMDGERKIVITTAKDAVRLKEIANIAVHLAEVTHVLPVNVQFIENEDDFLNKIYQNAGKDHKDG
ncbi:MAG: tetraacyldisaccharide 4'-kinase [Bacteroidales bacterium]|nr:tetraacyldisaccharide 4'-kinase [Bacteroidales bacterium]